ncbi:PREDICTED: methionine--tRNA ligase, cytoplasmic-like [Camelina sativa]|uniref:methionine--tRNA ligase n=1 Tax=Camelina sativa TaxID=90675 RepID=A0ABM0X5L7_CAMSA|nr:PREDICTED: methionine--tRNA ligase, cytoplasmic-like [Camelina sativa]
MQCLVCLSLRPGVLSADVYARYCRLRGYNAIYICGTDDYGTTTDTVATETKALEENCSPEEICDKYHAIFVCDTNICTAYAYSFWRSQVSQTTPRICDSDHRFIELPLLEDKLVKYIMDTSVTESWSRNAIQPTMACLTDGLINKCVSRDLTWGLPGRHETYKDKVFYVWFDAPIGYVSITSCYTSKWEKWWKNPENVELYQFMGIDNVPFHTVMFPSAQVGSGEKWTLVKTISATEYLKYEGGNFSQSKGFGVFGNDVKDTNIPVEVWRYYLLTIRPEVSDTSFEWKDLQAKLNNKLLSLGNFVSRVLAFIAKPEAAGYGSVIPNAPGAESHHRTKLLGQKVGGLVAEYVEAMEKVKIKHGLVTAMLILGQGIRYWRIDKGDKTSCAVVVRTAAGLVHLLARLLEPFMPSFSREVFKQLNLPPHFSLSDERGEVLQSSRPWDILPHSHRIGTPQPLFERLTDEEVRLYGERFAGSLSGGRARDAEATRPSRRRSRPVETAMQYYRRATSSF